MKLVHISDLHLGKRVNGFSMLDEQQYILNEMLNIIKSESVSAVLISGDVYDKISIEATARADTRRIIPFIFIALPTFLSVFKPWALPKQTV